MNQSDRGPFPKKEYLKDLPFEFVTLQETKERHEIKKSKFPKYKPFPTYINYLPKGFVTYDQMVARVEQKKQTTNDVLTENTFDSSLDPLGSSSQQLCQAEAAVGQQESLNKSVLSSCSTSTDESFRLGLESGQNTGLISNGFIPITKLKKLGCKENNAQNATTNNSKIDHSESKDEMVKYNQASLKVSKKQNYRSVIAGEKMKTEDTFINVVHSTKTPTVENLISFVIMNVNGPDDKRGSVPSRRRHAIQSIIKRHRPSIVLFQEFKWKGIKGKIWDPSPLPDNYEYCGHEEASILYNRDSFESTNIYVNLMTVLERLQKSSNNGLHKVFPLDFDPNSRLYAQVLTYSGGKLNFLCISWHGPYNRKSVAKRVSYFEYLMEYLKQIYTKIKLPILVAGDFNVSIDAIEDLVKVPFHLYRYASPIRRQSVIDYFITTSELALFDISPLNFGNENRDYAFNEIFDHDPVIASMDHSSEPKTKDI